MNQGIIIMNPGDQYIRNGHLVKIVGFQSIGNPVLYHPIDSPGDIRACPPEQLRKVETQPHNSNPTNTTPTPADP